MLDVRAYMKALLTSLQGLEESGIIHRDIKPGNFLFSMKSQTGMLVDFGLTETESPSARKLLTKLKKRRSEDPDYTYSIHDVKGARPCDSQLLNDGSARVGVCDAASEFVSNEETRPKRQTPTHISHVPSTSLHDIAGGLAPQRTPHGLLRKSGRAAALAAGAGTAGGGARFGHSAKSLVTFRHSPSVTSLLNPGSTSSRKRRSSIARGHAASMLATPPAGVNTPTTTPGLVPPGGIASTTPYAPSRDSKRKHADRVAALRTPTNRFTSGLPPAPPGRRRPMTTLRPQADHNAPRAGTPGFRAPEVLVRSFHQTTAIDVWSAGVMMCCLLARRRVLFRCRDDWENLAQVMVLLGVDRVTAAALGQRTCSIHSTPSIVIHS